jgi:hypothetical protein
MAITYDKMPSSRITSSTRFALTTASQSTNAFGAQTYQIRIATGNLVGSGVCYFKVGEASGVTADSSSSAIIGSNVADYICVTPGQKVAVACETAGGFVTISEMS